MFLNEQAQVASAKKKKTHRRKTREDVDVDDACDDDQDDQAGDHGRRLADWLAGWKIIEEKERSLRVTHKHAAQSFTSLLFYSLYCVSFTCCICCISLLLCCFVCFFFSFTQKSNGNRNTYKHQLI